MADRTLLPPDPPIRDPDPVRRRAAPTWATRSRRQRVLLTVGAVFTLLLLVGAALAGQIWWKLNQIEEVDIAELDPILRGEPQNFLLVGSDSRAAISSTDPNAAVFLGDGADAFGQRADTMVLLRFDQESQKLDVLSIPRDLWVPIAGTDSTERINTAYSYEDGPNRLIRTIQEYLGVPIHHYAEVDFEGFQALVDELGGVPMYFDTLYQDPNSGLSISEPGCVTLDGRMALAFVRSRHLQYMTEEGYWETDPTADLGRISRQQIFLRSALAEAQGRASLLNPVEYNRMLDLAVAYLRLDSGLEPSVLAAMGQRYAEFEGESITTHSLPVEGWSTPGGAAVLRLETGEAQRVLNVFRGLPPDHVDESWVQLTVLNGSGVMDQAGLVQEAYEAVGFTVVGIGDVPRPDGENLSRTRVRYAPGSRRLAELVERHLTAPGLLVEDPTLEGSEVVLETGLDFTTVEQSPRLRSSPPATEPGSAGGGEQGPSSTTTTTAVGRVVGEPPEGVECG